MDESARHMDGLVALAGAELPVAGLLAAAAQLLADAGPSGAAAVYQPTEDGLTLTTAAGVQGEAPPALLPLPDGWPSLPPGWSRMEAGRLDVAITTDDGPVALLTSLGTSDPAFQQRVAHVAGVAISRRTREETLARSVGHFAAAQRISHVGSYDFDIVNNTNDWSDQLYRIYGREPQSFMATYEKFLEMVHPEDREKIVGVHQEALANLAPYEMEERIVWPDGTEHTLASWGEVIAGPDGNPARMVGICWDITETKTSAAALARSSARFQQLIQSAPDVVLVVSQSGTVLQANDCVTDVLGWEPADVVGRPVTRLLPDGLAATSAPTELTARHQDGREIPVEVSTSEIETDGGTVIAAFVRDLRERKRSEELSLRLHDAGVRRRHALEINDNVVQGLASVLYLLDLDRHSSAHAAARRTMTTARAMMDDLWEDAGTRTLSPGELVRGEGHVATLDEVVPPQPPATAGAVRVLLADDAEDIRLLLRLTLTTTAGFDVVAEAGDGRRAVQLAAEHQPDVVLLDLSMPVMDGLQAIPEIRRVSPDSLIIVLSGFDEGRMKPVALELGAVAYVEKGEAATNLVEMLAGLFPGRLVAPAQALPLDPEQDGGLAFDGDMVVHELRTPLTVITGMLGTLRDRMDVLPAATTRELVDTAGRNARQMAELLDVVSDARRASHGRLPVVPEPTDLSQLVLDVVHDMSSGHGWPAPAVRTQGEITVAVDPMRIRQVVANLLSNAYKFSPAGTPVTVTVTATDSLAEIVVHDDGPGIPSERRHELFSKFGRLGQMGPGMGLGLYISRAIARAHGGELELRDGPGATFALSLPMSTTAKDDADSAAH